MSLSQETPKSKVEKIDEDATDTEGEKKTQKDALNTQDVIDSVRKSAQKMKKTGTKSLHSGGKKDKKSKKVKAEAKAIVSKSDIE